MKSTDKKGLLLVLTGLPASGKDSVMKALLSDASLKFSRITTYATREMRKGEVNGVDHFFVNQEEFHLLQKNGLLLEHVRTGTTLKGTPKEPFLNIAKFNHRCIWRIDPYRSAHIKSLFQKKFDKKVAEQLYTKTVTVFINVTNKDALKKRWLGRKNNEDINQFEIRFKKDMEIFNKLKGKYDYVINNDRSLKKTIAEIKKIVEEISFQQ